MSKERRKNLRGDEAWLDNDANHVDEDVLIDTLENASDYERGLSHLDLKQKRLVQKLQELAGGMADDSRKQKKPISSNNPYPEVSTEGPLLCSSEYSDTVKDLAKEGRSGEESLNAHRRRQLGQPRSLHAEAISEVSRYSSGLKVLVLQTTLQADLILKHQAMESSSFKLQGLIKPLSSRIPRTRVSAVAPFIQELGAQLQVFSRTTKLIISLASSGITSGPLINVDGDESEAEDVPPRVEEDVPGGTR
ncbi:hypothetical protein FB451DRAFT_1180890 [Mycena latifolia]|nr:hypothetical protein FB451DRAFT_1180890 [Mycena latifolia]